MNPAGFARSTRSNLDLQPTAQVQLLVAVLSRWWLLAVFLLLGGGATYLSLSLQPVTYQASATVLVGTSGPGQGNAGLVTATQDVIQTYSVLMTQRSVLIAVNDRLRLGLRRPEALNSEIKVEQRQGTSLLIVTVLDANSRHAVDIANAVPDEFIKIESNIGATGSADEHAVLIQQINTLQTDVDRLNAEIASLSAGPQTQTNQAKLSADRNQQTFDLASLTQLRVNLSASSAATPKIALTVVDPAYTAAKSSWHWRDVAAGAAVGLLIGIGAAVMLHLLRGGFATVLAPATSWPQPRSGEAENPGEERRVLRPGTGEGSSSVEPLGPTGS